MEKMTKKILILGATGMLGHTLFDYLSENTDYEIDNLVFRSKLNSASVICDVTDKVAVASTIKSLKPDVIVNCIGVLIRGSELSASNAIYINAYFPHLLSDIAADIDAKLMHVSTDCVFSGKKGAYIESDTCDAADVYGKSKALGELNNDRDLTIRTSIIGPELKLEGEGLLHWYLQQSGDVNGFTQAYWGGVTTLELSKAIHKAIESDVVGLMHLTNGERISKLELLNLFKNYFPCENLTVQPYEGKKVDKSLSTERHDLGFSVASYDQMVREMRECMDAHCSLYAENYRF